MKLIGLSGSWCDGRWKLCMGGFEMATIVRLVLTQHRTAT